MIDEEKFVYAFFKLAESLPDKKEDLYECRD